MMSRLNEIKTLLESASESIINPRKKVETENLLFEAYEKLYGIVKDTKHPTLADLYDLYDHLSDYYDKYWDKKDESSLDFLENEVDRILMSIQYLEPSYESESISGTSSDSENSASDGADSDGFDDTETSTSSEEESISSKENKLKDINAFCDSSDDDEIVERNPYKDIDKVTEDEIQAPRTMQQLDNITSHFKEIKAKPGVAHQTLLNNPAVEGEKEPGNKKKNSSNFSKPLLDPKKLLNVSPSSPLHSLNAFIIPSFRGLAWSANFSKSQLFVSTRASWVGECSYASQAFCLSGIEIFDHTKSYLIKNLPPSQYKKYDLSELYQGNNLALDINNKNLMDAAKQLKNFFQLADKIKKPFNEWQTLFSNGGCQFRNSKKLANKELNLSEILSYSYVNNYDLFKEHFKKLPTILRDDKKNPDTTNLLTFIEKLPIPLGELSKHMPFLSEGQIPRHALLYSFQLKKYTKNNPLQPAAFYKKNLKPQKNKVYLGKLLISNNPSTLFSDKDKAIYIPYQDEINKNDVASFIIGEREIQHQGGNLQGSIFKSINIKLPKLNHMQMPKHYSSKYGLSEMAYSKFKDTFLFLIKHNEYNKLSWMYAESLLVAYLIHFHEIQIYKYCNKMAELSEKAIDWRDRDDSLIKNPFKP